MNKTSKVLIGMDMSRMDSHLINHLNFFLTHELSNATDIYFLNVIKNLDVPPDVLKEFPDLVKNAVGDRQAEMKATVQEHLGGKKGLKVHYLIKKGGILKNYLRVINDLKVDWVVIGRREKSTESGLLGQRLARRADCSLIIVPEGVKPNFRKIMVAVDFSEYSEFALREAVDLARRYDAKIICQNIFEVPTGYHYTGKSHTEFAEIMKKHSEKQFEKLIRKIKPGEVEIEAIFSLKEEEELIWQLHKTAIQQDVDAVFIGAKGMSSTTAIFIGSSAEKLIQMDSEFPLFVMRPKGKMSGLLDFLKGL